jgi:hypothetical protein
MPNKYLFQSLRHAGFFGSCVFTLCIIEKNAELSKSAKQKVFFAVCCHFQGSFNLNFCNSNFFKNADCSKAVQSKKSILKDV